MKSATTGKKVVVAMSGGVDSTVCAALLKQQGYDVVGCFMRLGSPGETAIDGEACDPSEVKIGHQGCCSINDAKDAQWMAAKLDIGFYVLNFKKDFGRIIDYFVAEYNAGRTPNPCVRCNDWLKFGKLLNYAQSIDADYVATGHYARLERDTSGRPVLRRGVDPQKDQSYVLFGLREAQLSRMILPIGQFHKDEIRDQAKALGLAVHDKPDSQEICFVPGGDYRRVVRSKTPDAMQAGEIVDEQGAVVGEHVGHQAYTIGQRRGLGIAAAEPRYVIEKDADENRIMIGSEELLSAPGLLADQTNWLIDWAVGDARDCEVQIRYNAQPVPAKVWRDDDDAMRVTFEKPQRAVAPGQAVVCYDADRVIAGGWIRDKIGRT